MATALPTFSITEILGSVQRLDRVLIGGWAGRDKNAVQHHIDELQAIGIAPPSQTPLFYEVSRDRLNLSGTIQDVGPESGGEVELVLWRLNGEHYVGLGSDHTDRALESHSVALSKQICDKPVSTKVLCLTDIDCPLDELSMTCAVFEDQKWVPYQKGALDGLIPPLDLLARAEQRGAARERDNVALFCGTLSAIGGVRPGDRYKMTLTHPTGYDLITLHYTVERLAERI